jgi:hypothetical protein
MSSSSCSKKTNASPSRRGWRWAVLGCLLVSSLCSAASWRDELPQAVTLGEGDLRFLGFRIYHATLWAEQRPLQPDGEFALQLRYYRSISRQRLVQTSLDEMVRLSRTSIDAATLAQWNSTLSQAFTDVAPDDELVAVHLPGHGMRLYNRQRLLADIADTRLARAFFGIWLDEKTRDQGLRRQLMGLPP